ncbi:hypothetical protein BPAE_0058g00010 [Botrytis paeoniae]|uniref:Uncharacterized protein n=1 Tax=Botrytis paeoniae TaxID=278948 RepID=A0A4Z1FWF9_9HELO|nr:hypothetical protein BPAE_0058g00010 [Botrytis paeoniae]
MSQDNSYPYDADGKLLAVQYGGDRRRREHIENRPLGYGAGEPIVLRDDRDDCKHDRGDELQNGDGDYRHYKPTAGKARAHRRRDENEYQDNQHERQSKHRHRYGNGYEDDHHPDDVAEKLVATRERRPDRDKVHIEMDIKMDMEMEIIILAIPLKKTEVPQDRRRDEHDRADEHRHKHRGEDRHKDKAYHHTESTAGKALVIRDRQRDEDNREDKDRNRHRHRGEHRNENRDDLRSKYDAMEPMVSPDDQNYTQYRDDRGDELQNDRRERRSDRQSKGRDDPKYKDREYRQSKPIDEPRRSSGGEYGDERRKPRSSRRPPVTEDNPDYPQSKISVNPDDLTDAKSPPRYCRAPTPPQLLPPKLLPSGEKNPSRIEDSESRAYRDDPMAYKNEQMLVRKSEKKERRILLEYAKKNDVTNERDTQKALRKEERKANERGSGKR